MREEQIHLARNKIGDGHFLDAHEHITVAKVIGDLDARCAVFVIRESAYVAVLANDLDALESLLDFDRLQRGKRNALVRWNFAFANETDPESQGIEV